MKRFLIAMVLAAIAVETASAQGLRNSLLNRRNRNNPATAAKQEAQPQMTRDDLKKVARGTNGVPALAFNQAPVDLVLEAYAAEVGKTVIPAPDLPKATITLRSLEGQTLTKKEYLEAIEVTLTMNGVVLEPRGDKFLRALPRKTVRTHGIALRMDDKGNLPEEGRVVSQMIVFKNIAVDEAQKALEGFKAPEGLFQVFERTNAILVTDTQENINRMLEVVRAIDIATPVIEDVFVRQVEYALATEIKNHLETIVTESQKDENPKKSGPKQSGAPGFGSSQSSPRPSLLNLRSRLGQQQPQTPVNTPNANLIAAVSDADRGMIRGKVLIVADERSNKLIIITNKSNMDFFDKVIKTLDVETTPEVQIDVIRLKYAEAEEVEQMLNNLIGASSSSSSNKNNQNANTKKGGTANSNLTRGTTQQRRTSNPTFQNANASRLGELNKDNVKVLADKRINGIVVMARKADMKAIREVIDNMDVKLSQVLLETVIVQVELGDELSTGIDWVNNKAIQNGDQIGGGGGSNAGMVNSLKGGGSSSKTYSQLAQEAKSVLQGTGGAYGNNNLSQADIDKYIENAIAYDTTASGITPAGAGINYFLKSDKLNITAVINASKSDSRTKVLASPIIMTVDNKEATIEATDMIYLFSGYQYSGSANYGSQVRNYEKRDIGLTVKVTPKINPNGTVMLTVEQTFETQGADQSVPNEAGGTDPYATVTTRKISSDVSVENRQTVVMGGLTRKTQTESESGIPILKDIPWIGKWIFGSVNMTEKRSELLVFMTPYVLDDAESAQSEALRRKKSLSDSRPWEDEGWSASPLADPVSKKEQLRRFKDEWKKQDEERKAKLAIEKAKMDRARKLEAMSEEERKAWIEIHKDELDKEAREAFEKKVEEQKDLKDFVEQLKKQDLEKSEKALKAAKEESDK
jgi:general secretion pathway protein D